MSQIAQLEKRISALETLVFSLTGQERPGKITMREAREACERGDKETVRKFNEQYRSPTI